ncbi:MAG TPA: VOC family protein [Gemmatimonadales bacterium]|nr:VOC family protein [Gemmatimonadales bacterium]
MPNGKICYLEIPTDDVERSARFYTDVFRWTTRVRGDGQHAFDDTTGAVSGAWVLGRPPQREPGMLAYIMVDSIERTLAAVTKGGGRVMTPLTALHAAGEAFATIADPAGNVVGLYQEPGQQRG